MFEFVYTCERKDSEPAHLLSLYSRRSDVTGQLFYSCEAFLSLTLSVKIYRVKATLSFYPAVVRFEFEQPHLHMLKTRDISIASST